MFNEEIENCYIETFLGETINKAILDSGCTETVCGNVWLQCYLDSLNKEESAKVQSQSSSKVFRFGDGKCYDATRKVIFQEILWQISGSHWEISEVSQCNGERFIPRTIFI